MLELRGGVQELRERGRTVERTGQESIQNQAGKPSLRHTLDLERARLGHARHTEDHLAYGGKPMEDGMSAELELHGLERRQYLLPFVRRRGSETQRDDLARVVSGRATREID